MVALLLPRHVREELIAHAREGDPDEVCGILAGRDNQIERLYRIRNAAEDVDPRDGIFRDRDSADPVPGRKPVHYFMDQKDLLRVSYELDDLELDIVAYYHSHTHSPARPSPTDVRLASDTSAYYVLVSLAEKQHPHVRAWKIVKDDPGAETGEVIEQDVTLS